MTNKDLSRLIVELFNARQQKSEAEKLEKSILEALRPLADPEFDRRSGRPIIVGDIQFSRVSGATRSISADLLLERGVAPDVISYATKVTSYTQYRTTRLKTRQE